MTHVTFVATNGEHISIDADEGTSLMENGRRAGVDGIIAECGGACACATCHVHVAKDWVKAVGGPDDIEREMLEFATNVQPNSRLSCQINVTAQLEGLVVYIPGE